MSRGRLISVIVVLVLANYLVVSYLVMLFYTAGNEAVQIVAATRTPRPTATIEPTEVPPTATASPTLTPPPTNTPTLEPTSTPTITPTRAVGAYPTFAPVGTGTPIKYPFQYTVKAGDTLSGIAGRFAVPPKKLLEANNLLDQNLIRIGQVLIIPDPNQ